MKVRLILAALIVACGSAFAGTAFYVSETPDGNTKQCFYEYHGTLHTRPQWVDKPCPSTLIVADW